jgi:aldehyde:ferredoxin oxidoreductase
MPDVYAGRLLRLDLSSGTQHIEPVEDADVRRYLLGSGLAAKI